MSTTTISRRVDESKIPNLGNVFPSMMANSKVLGAVRDGKWYALPYDWGTEALAWNTEKVTLEYGDASFGDIWKPEYKGLMLCRQRSVMLTTGLWMERDGKLPAGHDDARPTTRRRRSTSATAPPPSS